MATESKANIDASGNEGVADDVCFRDENGKITETQVYADASKSVDIVGGDITQLSVSSAQIEGMSLDGEMLVLTFKDGGSIKITNFHDLANENAEIILADDTVYKAKDLYERLAGDLAPVEFVMPENGQSLVYRLEPGRQYEFNTDPENGAQAVEEDGALIISFDNGGKLILQNFQEAMASENPPEMSYGDNIISLREFSDVLKLASAMSDEMAKDEAEEQVAQAEIRSQQGQEDDLAALAQQLAEVEPAAGEAGGAAGRGGFGFQSSVDSAPLDSPDAIGPIGPTELQFGLPEFRDELFAIEEQAPSLPRADAPDLLVDNAQVKEDGSVFVPLEAYLTDTDGSEYLTVTVKGVPAGWTFTGAGWTEPTPGTWTITMPAGDDYVGGFTLAPPAESDVDLTGLVITAKSTETVGGDTAQTSEAIDVIVDAVADKPDVDGLDNTGNEGDVLAVNVSGSLGSDTDGSETITGYQISGVPAGFSFNAGTDAGGGVWTFTPAELAGLQITPPADFTGSINLVATIFTTENPVSDGEVDYSDNDNQDTDSFTLTWNPVANPPTIDVNGLVVDEDSLITLPVEAKLAPGGSGNEVLTVSITGIDPSWTLQFTEGSYNPATQTWSYTAPAGQDYSGQLTMGPFPDSDVDMTGLVAVMSVYEPASATTATVTSDPFDILVDAVADTPDVDASGIVGLVNTALDIEASASVTDTDGSESIAGFIISGVPAGFSLNVGTDNLDGTWSVDPADIAALQITAPTDFVGSLNLTVTAIAEETTLSDLEPDFTDNVATNDVDIKVQWLPVSHDPILSVGDQIVDEDSTITFPVIANLAPGGTGNEVLTVTVTGIDPTWSLQFNEGSYDAGTGTWTYTAPAGQDYSGQLTMGPFPDSDVDLTGLQASASVYEPASGTTSSVDAIPFDIIVDAVADTPDVDANGIVGHVNTALDIEASASVTDTDGSESITGFIISGVPAGFSLNVGTDNLDGTWNVAPGDIASLQITSPTDFVGTVNLTVTAIAEETNTSDVEPDLTDNIATASTDIAVTWLPVAGNPFTNIGDVIVKEDGSVNVPIVATLSSEGSGNEILTVTVTGIGPGWGFSAPVGTYNAGTGTWTVVLPAGESLSTVMTFTPPADSDIDLNGLVATATAYEPATDTSASATDGFDIIVDAVADTPNLNASNANGEEGTTIALNISTSVTDTDGSETISVVRISGVPAGTTLTAGTEVAPGVWELSTADLPGLGINVPDGVTGNYTLDVESVATEAPVSDNEVDFTDNEASAFDVIRLCIKEDDAPEIAPEEKTVDETNLGPIVVNDSVSVNYGADTGSVAANGGFFSGVTLMSGGIPVLVTLVGNTYTGKAGAETIFTMALQPNGNYQFTLLGTLDHPDKTDPNDSIMLQFGLTATDNEGDATNSVITINVLDDGLTAHHDVNDYQVINGGTNGNVITGLNGGPGAADDLSNDLDNTVTQVRFGTTTVNVPDGGSTTIDGNYGQLEIFSNGTYNYTLFGGTGGVSVDHEFNETLEFPLLSGGVAISGDALNNLGIYTDDLKTDGPSTGTITFVSEGAGFNNTFGMYTVADDGTLQTAEIIIRNGNNPAPGTEYSFSADANQEIAFFIIANGYTENSSYSGIDLNNGTLQFVYKYGTAEERAANIADDGADVALIYTNNTTLADTVLQGAVYHTTERGSTNNLNTDDSVRVVSGLADASDSEVLRIGFEDLPNLGDQDYEDIIFDVTYATESHECPIDVFEYTLTDGDGDSSVANLTLDGECPPPVDVCVVVNNCGYDLCVKEDGSIFVNVDAQVTGGNGNEILTLLLTGVAAGWGFSGAGWAATGNPGEYKVTLPAGQKLYDGGFVLAPPADSDVDLTGLSVKASVYDPDTDSTVMSQDGFSIFVDAVADAPTLDVSMPSSSYNTGAGERWDVIDGEDITSWNYKYWGSGISQPFTIIGAVTDTDGSESITHYTVILPAVLSDFGITFSAGTEIAPGVWEISAADAVGLQIVFPSIPVPDGKTYAWQNPDYIIPQGIHEFVVTAHSAETNLSGQECNPFDNTASTTKVVEVTIVSSPLVLDLDGDGVELVSVSEGVLFDMDNDGVADKTGWVGADDGLLAIDINGDGVINDHTELFGTAVTDGFAVLASYDINGDGVINDTDAVWSDLIVWQDANQDGISQDTEMSGLSSVGISSINLSAVETSYWQDGNWISHEGTFLYEDGREGQIVDAWFSFYNGANGLEPTEISGDDSANAIYGSSRDDVLYGQGGDDMLFGGAGDDVLYGGAGADTFGFDSLAKGIDTIADFDLEGGDRLDFTQILEQFDPVSNAINDFVYVADNGTDTVIAIDVSGTGDISNAVGVVVLEGVTGLSAEELVSLQNSSNVA
ncbi:MAG: type I secretion C-terminal target domain-containing protein [Rhodospirillales bacterium]|nr:type I secretion C-terminal target domain-containing protein [Rhodospirillales bacterium]